MCTLKHALNSNKYLVDYKHLQVLNIYKIYVIINSFSKRLTITNTV